jgi:hypothetical protein
MGESGGRFRWKNAKDWYKEVEIVTGERRVLRNKGGRRGDDGR